MKRMELGKRITIALIVTVIVVIAFFVIGGCGGGGDGNGGDGEVANPLFNGAFGGTITKTQGEETLPELVTLILFAGSPLSGAVRSGVVALDGEEFSISGDAVGNFATFSGEFDSECTGTINGTLELIPEDTVLLVAEGSDCDGQFSSSGTLTRCSTREEIADSDCPAEAVLGACEPYFCGGCNSSICFDFIFSEFFSGCQATGCNTINCNEADEIMVNRYPSGTIELDGQPVPFTCDLTPF